MSDETEPTIGNAGEENDECTSKTQTSTEIPTDEGAAEGHDKNDTDKNPSEQKQQQIVPSVSSPSAVTGKPEQSEKIYSIHSDKYWKKGSEDSFFNPQLRAVKSRRGARIIIKGM